MSPRGVLGRVGWSFGDQGLSSATNALVAFLVARSVTPTAFGIFTFGFLAYGALLGISRSLTSEPLVVRRSTTTTSDSELQYSAALSTGTALVLGLIGAAVCLFVAAVANGQVRTAFLAFALVMPGLLTQDALRFVFFAAARPSQAFANDLTWAALQISALFVVLSADSTPSIAAVVVAWGFGATGASVLGFFQVGVAPRPGGVRAWLAENGRLGRRFAYDFVMMSGATQAGLLALGAIAGSAELASLRSAQVLMGPVTVLIAGAHVIALPEGTRMREKHAERLPRAACLLALVLTALVATWGVVALLLPDSIGSELLGENWKPARDLLPLVVLATTVQVTSVAALFGLRVLQAGRHILVARTILAPLTLGGAVVGAVVAGADGTATASVAVGLVAAVIWWRQYGAAYKAGGDEGDTVSVPEAERIPPAPY